MGAALLVLVTLGSTSGDLTEPPIQVGAYWADVALIVAGGVALAALVIAGRRGAGTPTLCLFGALALLSALSIAWSVAPDHSWEESGRTVAYLGVFSLGLVTARLSTRDTAGTGAVLTLTLALTGLSVWALLVKVLDLDLYGQPTYGRLLAPFGYWNATGLTGAMALPGLIWLASGHGQPASDTSTGSGSPTLRTPARGWAVAGIAIAVTVVALSYSRSAVAAALFGAILPLWVLGTRRRAVVMLALGILGALPICLYALIDNDISGDGPNSLYGDGSAHLHRAGAGLLLGIIVLIVTVLLVLAGSLLTRRLDAHPQPAERLRRFDRGLWVLVGAVPLLIVLWLLFNARGPSGEISHLWHSLTANNPDTGDGYSRLGSLANSRSAYWRQALSVGRHHLLAGAGADSFYPALQRYSDGLLTPAGNSAHHAHSYVLDAFASFGLIGVALNLALFGSWCRNAAQAVRSRGRGAGAAIAASELDARWALIAVVVAFGASSTIDYTWYFPGVALPALLAAGWIAGVGRPLRPAAAPLVVAGPTRPALTPPKPLTARSGAILVLAALAAVTLAIAWETLQPMRAIQSASASLNAQVAADTAATRGDPGAEARDAGTALADARAAVSEDPLSADALSRLATVDEALGRPSSARAALVKATQVQPENPLPFSMLGDYLLRHRDFSAARGPLSRATVLDITDAMCQRENLTAAEAHHPPVSCIRSS